MYVGYLDESSGVKDRETIVIQKFKHNINVMASAIHIKGLELKFASL